MHALTSLAKPDEWTLLSVVLLAPLFGAFFNGIFGKRLGRPAVRLMALTAMAVSFGAALITFLAMSGFRHEAEEALKVAHGALAQGHGPEAPATKLSWFAWRWLSMASPIGDGRLDIDVKYSVDELSGVMMLVITGVGFLIHLYASSYMAKDPGYYRFFAYLNLFIFSMLTLVLADNMPLMFVGWEGVGLCSYLLIGFWFSDAAKASAGRKAFIANRIGDVGILVGMFVLLAYTKALDWDGISAGAEGLTDRIVLLRKGEGVLSLSAATVACLALFVGCTGKSAQIPLYVWLPDAMAGPTPVSALIHAATMVTSGLYLICRLNVVFTFSPFAMMIVAIVGALTALFAATIGLVQNDIKKVLAYSTVSQLGFMFLGVGSGAFGMGFFHVLTHAFFKACLFLGAGSVIHAMHARIHDEAQSQDMRLMGGLRRYMPWTYLAMGASTLAISGLPLTSGFFSKDGLLFHVFTNRIVHPHVHSAEAVIDGLTKSGRTNSPEYSGAVAQLGSYFEAPRWVGPTLFAIGILAATCTAFYMFRLLFKTFWGEFRGWKVDPNAPLLTNPIANAEALDDGGDDHGSDHGHGHDDHHGHDDGKLAAPPAEAPWQMAFPVALLGVLALFAGFLYAEPLHIEPLGHWLEPVFAEVSKYAFVRPGLEKLEWPLMIPGVLAFFVGATVAFLWYVKGEEVTPRRLAEALPRLHRAAYNKWYVDEIYDATIINGTDALADGVALMDVWVVDGILAKLTALVASASGAVLRALQNGVVHVYAGAIALGTVVLVFFFTNAHAAAITYHQGDTFTVEAAPGLGYVYRWSDGGDLTDEFAGGDAAQKRSFVLKPDEKKLITLEVKNAFGRVSKQVFTLDNARPATSPVTASEHFHSSAAPIGGSARGATN